ncbi:MAG: hypothetical protein Q9186_007106 [Xanthomendoza sp. 1 TL-2023]
MDGRGKESSLSHGQKKRPANDNLESEQRLSKRFNLLNLGLPNPSDHNGKLYLPVQGNAPRNASDQNESMQLDDTRDRVYVHNLDAELADIESDEDTPIYLADIEKKLSKIPRSVLVGSNPPVTNNQMILYNVPSSLSVPEEQDNVRRVIIDTRMRAREKQAQEHMPLRENGFHHENGMQHANNRNGIAGTEDMDLDENAMDIG